MDAFMMPAIILGWILIVIGLVYKNKRKIVLSKYYDCFGAFTAYVFTTFFLMSVMFPIMLIVALVCGDFDKLGLVTGTADVLTIIVGLAVLFGITFLIGKSVAKKAAKYGLTGTTWAMLRVGAGTAMAIALFFMWAITPAIIAMAERAREEEEQRRREYEAEQERKRNTQVYNKDTGENYKMVDNGEAYIDKNGDKHRVDNIKY